MFHNKIYNKDDKIFDIVRKKSGKIVNLRNDFREKKMRDIDPLHYYYHIDYDDGSFDTYVYGGNLISYKKENECPETQIETSVNYNPGQRFINTRTNKIGTIKFLRNDEYEKNQRKLNPSHYYYYVIYDDGSFETYEYGEYLKPI